MHEGSDIVLIGLGLMAQRAKKAAVILKEQFNVSASVLDLRTLVPLDLQSIKREVLKCGHVITVEENPRLCGWGAEISSLITEYCFDQLKGPVTRITTPHIPLPSADILEDKFGNWWGVFLGCRPYDKNDHFNTGRETFMAPVKWIDNWPVFDLEGDVVKDKYTITVDKLTPDFS